MTEAILCSSKGEATCKGSEDNPRCDSLKLKHAGESSPLAGHECLLFLTLLLRKCRRDLCCIVVVVQGKKDSGIFPKWGYLT